MGRVNKSTEGVFVNIVGTIDRRPAYNLFINQEVPEDGISHHKTVLAELLSEYDNKISKHKMDFLMLSNLEVLIMQLRTRVNYKDTVKLYFIKKPSGVTYIYARCPFFRKDSETNEIRVLIANADLHTDSQDDHALSILSGNETFMNDHVYYRLEKAMDEEIDDNLNVYKKIYQK